MRKKWVQLWSFSMEWDTVNLTLFQLIHENTFFPDLEKMWKKKCLCLRLFLPQEVQMVLIKHCWPSLSLFLPLSGFSWWICGGDGGGMQGVPVVNIGHEIIMGILSDRLHHLEFGWHGKCTLCFPHLSSSAPYTIDVFIACWYYCTKPKPMATPGFT